MLKLYWISNYFNETIFIFVALLSYSREELVDIFVGFWAYFGKNTYFLFLCKVLPILQIYLSQLVFVLFSTHQHDYSFWWRTFFDIN